MRGFTMRRDRLPDLRAICDHQHIGWSYFPEYPKWTPDECRAGWTRIKRNADAMREDLIQFCLSEGWVACGYETFEDLCDEQLYGMRFPSIEARREAVKQFTEAGVPTKTISTAFGQDRKTTWRDQQRTGVRPRPAPHISTSRDVPYGTSDERHDVVQSHVVVEVEEERWTAPKRDAGHLMAYQEGWTETAPPPDLHCVEETIRLFQTGEDHVPDDAITTLYHCVRSTAFRRGLLGEEAR